MNKTDHAFMIEHLPVLGELPFDRLLLWACRMVPVRYTAGLKLQCGSNNRTGLMLLKSGSLRIFLLSQDGRELTLYHLSAGETCVLSTGLAAETVVFDVHIEAETDCEILLMSADSFAGFCREHAFIEIYFGRLLTKRVSLSVQVLERALSMNLNQRLAIFLVDEIAELNGDDIELTHDQIARHIGSTREVVTRTLGLFADWGMVKLTRGNVKILDQDKLDNLSQ